MKTKLFILLIGISFVGCGNSTDKLNGVWVSGDLNKAQAVVVIENGIWAEYVSGFPFYYEADLDGERLTLIGENLFTGEHEEVIHKVQLKNDSLFIVNEQMVDFLFVRKGSSSMSEIIISNSKRKISLPKVDYCEIDGVNNQHDIFIDKQNNIDRTILLDEESMRLEELALVGLNSERDEIGGTRLINLFVDNDVSYEYLKDVQLQLRLSNNLRIRYVLDEYNCSKSNDSTQLFLNYFRTNLPPFKGDLNDSLGLILPPGPPPYTVEEEDLFNVKMTSKEECVLNGVTMNMESFPTHLDSFVKSRPKYVMVYSFTYDATFNDYLNFRVMVSNQFKKLRNDYSIKEFGVSFEQLRLNMYEEESDVKMHSDSFRKKWKSVKKKIPQRFTTQEDYDINKKLSEDVQ